MAPGVFAPGRRGSFSRGEGRHRLRPWLFLWPVLLFTVACAGSPFLVTVIPLGEGTYPRTSSVHLFHGTPERPYEQIAQIIVEAPIDVEPEEMYREIGRRAVSLGADAVISLKLEERLLRMEPGPAGMRPVYEYFLVGIAVRFKS